MNKKQKCAICGKPVSNQHPLAQIYHLQCAFDSLKEVRKNSKYVNTVPKKEK